MSDKEQYLELLQYLRDEYDRARQNAADARKDGDAIQAEYYAGMKAALAQVTYYVSREPK